MLSRLHIQNYAIIEDLEIEFSGRLNVITGETGAGKSIIAGALGLILGQRADTTVLVNTGKKCFVEGTFSAEQKKTVKEFLSGNDLDPGEELVLRREITANGKSRAFINDTPVNLSQLQQLGSLLVDLHQQFDTLELAGSDFQREVLDALAGHAGLLEEYRESYLRWQEIKRETASLKDRQQQWDKEADYDRFRFRELEEASFKDDELEEAEAELKMLNNAEGIRNTLEKINNELMEGESPMVQQLKLLANQLAAISSFHPGLPVLMKRLQSSQVELADIAADLERMNGQVNYDPARIEQLNERVSLGFTLMKKHGVRSTAELLAVQRQLDEKLQSVQNLEEQIRRKEKEMSLALEKAVALAGKITAGRLKQVKPLAEKVNKRLAQVGMPNAVMKAEVKTGELQYSGADTVEFLFDANLPAGEKENKGSFQPLRKVASGGELSRLMLCIKSLVAQSIDLPTLVFDEIDSGISGEAARQVGLIMKELASRRQLICITHQPQIAGKADLHLFVYKEIVNQQVRTNIRPLTPEERITTIAKMLSGEKPTAAAIENAREMLMN